MTQAQFKDASTAKKYGLTVDDIGNVTATETRDGGAFVNVTFVGVEVLGLPAETFTLTE